MNAWVRAEGAGAVSAMGVGVAQTDAALRAKVGRYREASWSPHGARTVMALVSDELLEPGYEAAEPVVRTSWQARLVALAAGALLEAAPDDDAPLTVMLGLADPREVTEIPSGPILWAALERATGVRIDAKRSRTFPLGRAAIFAAYEAARQLCLADPTRPVLCVAVDSYANVDRVGREEDLGRTLPGKPVAIGRALAEAAGFVRLRAVDRRERGAVEIVGAAVVEDRGHRFATEPALGEGVAESLEVLRERVALQQRFGTVWAGMNGEAHDGRCWGVAALRHRDLFDARTRLEHPADRFGDAGAGLGAMLFVAAVARLQAARRPGPSLLWATSDHGACGCAVMRNEADTGGIQ